MLLRWAFAFLLLAATFNPTPYNYIGWALENGSDELPLAVFLALMLIVGYVIYLRATIRSIGAFGMVLVAAIVAALFWVLVDWGILELGNTSLDVWLGIFAMSVVLGIGLSWSIIRKRLSGQADVDDVDT